MPATATTPTAQSILAELEPLGSESYKKTLLRHGIREPVYGVKIEHLKKVQRRVKKDYQLALDLYDSGVYDAMYLAGLIADERRMTKKDLKRWLARASSATLCDYTVPWVAAESAHGRELALEWIDSKDAGVASAGWNTLSGLVALKSDDDKKMAGLSARGGEIHFTLDGTDPRASGGEISQAAQNYKAPIPLKPGAKLFARVREANRWGGPLIYSE